MIMFCTSQLYKELSQARSLILQVECKHNKIFLYCAISVRIGCLEKFSQTMDETLAKRLGINSKCFSNSGHLAIPSN